MSNTNAPKSSALFLAAGAALLLLTSCAPEAPQASSGDSPTTQSPSDGAEETPDDDAAVSDDEVPDGRIDAAAAIEAALQAVPGDVVELELERERTGIVWEVGVLGGDGSGIEVSIDSKSGEAVGQQSLRLSSAQRTAPAVTASEAVGIALEAADGRVKAMDLDTERGAVVWEVEVLGARGGTELYIDAASGAVVKQERM